MISVVNKCSLKIVRWLFVFSALICCKKTEVGPTIISPPYTMKSNPIWRTGDRVFLEGIAGTFDDVSVKDPTIVNVDGKWHVFYTGRDATKWRMGYIAGKELTDLKKADRNYMTSLNGGSYFCAPQVFQLKSKKTWYLIYQSGLGATFSTNTDINSPQGWSAGKAMGFTDGIDFWCISDGTKIHCFYSAQDGSFTIKKRSTLVADFPYKWSEPVVVATDTFEAPHVYKNKADGKYYMMVEDIRRYFEIWQASSLDGTWTKLNEKWADYANLIETNEHWTDQVSHGEILRSGIDEMCEIEDINHCQVIFQGVVNGNYADYGIIPYDLGIMKNY